MADTSTDWQDEAVRLRRDEKMATADIAAIFGKSASQVRRVIAQAQTERAVNGSHTEEAPNDLRAWPAQDGMGAQEPEPQGDITAALANPEDPLHAFKREAGPSVGAMPPTDPPADPEEPETRYRGTRQTCLDFGPNADLPTGGTLVVKSEKLASGFFGRGDVITGTFTARITKVGSEEKFDKASEEYRAEPVPHVATITEISYEPVSDDG
jgi:hypothetical protein